MKIALFAPYVASDSGGIWQYYQWVIRNLHDQASYLLFAPDDLLREIVHTCGDATTRIAADKFISGACQLPDVCSNWQKITGLKRRLIADLAARLVFRGSPVEHAVYRMLKQEGVDIVHNPGQHLQMPAAVRRFPHIINPHDFQHEHFPEFFTGTQIEYRRAVWYADQRNASALVVHSRQTRDDVFRFLSVPEERVFYAPYGPLDTFPEPDTETIRLTAEKFNLPLRFIFYPARTWPHKNHLALVEAARVLHKKGIDVHMVFTIADREHGEKVKRQIAAAGLQHHVTIVGMVPPETMGALYRLSTMVVVPTLFEQNSGPVLEAIHYGKAVAASRLDEVVHSMDGAGILFDPRSIEEIAGAIDRLWSSDVALENVENGIKKRREQMSWEPFREAYRNAYAFAMRQTHRMHIHAR